MTSLEDLGLHVTPVTHRLLGAKWQPGHAGWAAGAGRSVPRRELLRGDMGEPIPWDAPRGWQSSTPGSAQPWRAGDGLLH